MHNLIEFDAWKRRQTWLHRGLDFRQASEVFAGLHLTWVDDRRDYGEPRFITVGWLQSKVVVVVWTWRGPRRRIISMRRANEREIQRFEKDLD